MKINKEEQIEQIITFLDNICERYALTYKIENTKETISYIKIIHIDKQAYSKYTEIYNPKLDNLIENLKKTIDSNYFNKKEKTEEIIKTKKELNIKTTNFDSSNKEEEIKKIIEIIIIGNGFQTSRQSIHSGFFF